MFLHVLQYFIITKHQNNYKKFQFSIKRNYLGKVSSAKPLYSGINVLLV